MPRVVRPSFDSAPITPPLTPESTAFSDVSTVDRLREVYKSPPQPQVSLDSPASPSHPAISLQGDLAAAQSQWAHRPAVIRSQSISFISRAASRLDSDPAFLLSLLNLPNAENSDHAAPPGRFLLVSTSRRSVFHHSHLAPAHTGQRSTSESFLPGSQAGLRCPSATVAIHARLTNAHVHSRSPAVISGAFSSGSKQNTAWCVVRVLR